VYVTRTRVREIVMTSVTILRFDFVESDSVYLNSPDFQQSLVDEMLASNEKALRAFGECDTVPPVHSTFAEYYQLPLASLHRYLHKFWPFH
jgi:hypothetical protein